MYARHYTSLGLRALTAFAIVYALGYTFEYGHSMSFAELLRPLLGS